MTVEASDPQARAKSKHDASYRESYAKELQRKVGNPEMSFNASGLGSTTLNMVFKGSSNETFRRSLYQVSEAEAKDFGFTKIVISDSSGDSWKYDLAAGGAQSPSSGGNEYDAHNRRLYAEGQQRELRAMGEYGAQIYVSGHENTTLNAKYTVPTDESMRRSLYEETRVVAKSYGFRKMIISDASGRSWDYYL
jgi:hypothetical protein